MLLNRIADAVRECAPDARSILDIFAGTGVVGQNFKRLGFKVWSNDILYFSYVLQRCKITLNKRPKFSLPEDPIFLLNGLSAGDTGFSEDAFFIRNNYTPFKSSRMCFQPKNGEKIDAIRLTLEDWRKKGTITEDGYFYLLASLIEAVPFVANITGTYAAYLKFWDKRSGYDLHLQDIELFDNGLENPAFCSDYHDLLDISADLLYADPPYNSRNYETYYHVLETIARCDYPEIHGVTGMRSGIKLSPFCSKRNVKQAFLDLIEGWQGKYVLISYNNEAIMSSKTLEEICKNYAVNGTFKLFEFDYRRYKNKIPNSKPGLKEQLFFFRRR